MSYVWDAKAIGACVTNMDITSNDSEAQEAVGSMFPPMCEGYTAKAKAGREKNDANAKAQTREFLRAHPPEEFGPVHQCIACGSDAEWHEDLRGWFCGECNTFEVGKRKIR